jgi:hypothetical protein
MSRLSAKKGPVCATLKDMQQARLAYFHFYFWFSVPGGREAMA